MANVIALAISQYNGAFTVTGDIAATGYYSVVEGAVIQSFSGSVTSLGSFKAVLDSGNMKYALEPADGTAATAESLMEAALAIKELIESCFAVDAPAISGTTPFEDTTEVTISIPTRSTVYYTTDGSTPTSASSVYSEPITLDATTTVKAIAIKDGVSSAVASETFTKSDAAEGGEGE